MDKRTAQRLAQRAEKDGFKVTAVQSLHNLATGKKSGKGWIVTLQCPCGMMQSFEDRESFDYMRDVATHPGL